MRFQSCVVVVAVFSVDLSLDILFNCETLENIPMVYGSRGITRVQYQGVCFQGIVTIPLRGTEEIDW